MLRDELCPPSLKARPGHHAVLDRKQREKQHVDDQRCYEWLLSAGVDRLGHDDVSDKPDRVQEREKEGEIADQAGQKYAKTNSVTAADIENCWRK